VRVPLRNPGDAVQAGFLPPDFGGAHRSAPRLHVGMCVQYFADTVIVWQNGRGARARTTGSFGSRKIKGGWERLDPRDSRESGVNPLLPRNCEGNESHKKTGTR
jgi:hypothetical protein